MTSDLSKHSDCIVLCTLSGHSEICPDTHTCRPEVDWCMDVIKSPGHTPNPAHLIQPLGAAHDQEATLLVRQTKVVSHVHPHRAQLGDTVVPDRDPI